MPLHLPFYTFLASLATFLVCAVSAYLRSDIPLIWQVSGGIAVALLIASVVIGRGALLEIFSKKTTRYGMNAVLMSFIAFCILVLANVIASSHDIKKDFTKNQLHMLSDQSIKVLKGLQHEVILKAFINPTQTQDFQNIFNKFTYYTEKLKKDFVDVDKDPFVAQKYGIKQVGTIVIESEARTAKVENLMGPDDPKLEEKIVNAIIQVAKGEKKKIYFITGHGEKVIGDTGREGYSEIKESLESGRYKVEELVLIERSEVPADAEILICAGPKSDFMDQELKALEKYIKKGGKLLLMVEPTSTLTIKNFLAKYGADWKPKKTVLETNSLQQLAGGNPLTPIVTKYDPSHEITQEAKQLTLLPVATPIEKAANAPEKYKITSLMSTSNRSLEVDLVGDKVKVNEKTDRKGPLSVALAVSGKMEDEGAKDAEKPEADKKKDAEFRLVIVGDSDFATNSVRKFGMNADLFQNMLSWLAHEEDLISIRPRGTDASEFNITEERIRVINLASIVFAPMMMFLSGIVVWMTRKRA